MSGFNALQTGLCLFGPGMGGGAIAPVADFAADDTTPNNVQTITFTDLSTNTPTSWDWNFGDGSAHATTQNPTHVYTAAGTYTVTLTATNAGGEDTETKTDYITVSEATFAERMLALPGLIAYWPLNEAAGTTADNAEGTAARDGTYKNTPTLANKPFPDGGSCALFDGNNETVDVKSASLHTVFNGSKGWVIAFWADPAPGTAVEDYVFNFQVDIANRVYVVKGGTKAYLYTAYYLAGGTQVNGGFYSGSTGWRMVAVDWDKAEDKFRIWFNKVLQSTLAGLADWVAGSAFEYAALASRRGDLGSNSLAGNAGHIAVGAGQVLSDDLVGQIFDAAFPTVHEITFGGDSKTNDDLWREVLTGNIGNSTGEMWTANPPYYAGNGWKATDLHQYIDLNAPGSTANPEIICINIGVNDLIAGTVEATFKAELTGAIDGYRAKWPTALFYVAFPWGRNYNAQAATLKTWIEAVIATYPSGVAAGPDENTWLENGDDGATYTSDGIHYSAAGQVEAANQWYTALGYS